MLKGIKEELRKYGLVVIRASKHRFGWSTVYLVAAKGELWKSPLIDQLWTKGAGGYTDMVDIMYENLHTSAPETTQITIVDAGDNVKKVSYLIFVFGGKG